MDTLKRISLIILLIANMSLLSLASEPNSRDYAMRLLPRPLEEGYAVRTADAWMVPSHIPELQKVSAKLTAVESIDRSDQIEDLMRRVNDLESRLQEQESSSFFEEECCLEVYPTAELHGRIMADWVWFHQDEQNIDTFDDIQDGSGFRRARLASEGWLAPKISYELEMEFVTHGDEVKFKDLLVEIIDLPVIGNVRVGHYKEPFGLDYLISSRYITFMERAAAYRFIPRRNLGISAYDVSDDLSSTWAIGGFRTGGDDFGDDVGDDGEHSVTGRLTNVLYYDEESCGRRMMHLGAAYSYRDADENELRYRARPEVRLDEDKVDKVPRFVDTGDIANTKDFQLFGTEAAIVHGPLSLQAEYIASSVKRTTGQRHTFYGTYLQASFFLTGEHRPYDREIGEFHNLVPFEDFWGAYGCDASCHGWGAWEIAARWSHIQLNDDEIQGGRMNNWVFGLNWYLTANMRWMFNYIHSNPDDPADGSSEADIFATRVQIFF